MVITSEAPRDWDKLGPQHSHQACNCRLSGTGTAECLEIFMSTE